MDLEDDIIDDECRSPQDISKRALILIGLIEVVYGQAPSRVFDWIKNEGLWEELSPYELEFTKNTKNKKACINISWRSKALVSLLWCIGVIEELQPLNEQLNFSQLSKALGCVFKSTSEFIKNAKLRDKNEIETEYEVVYDSHWKSRDAKIHKKPYPKDIDSGIVMERHHGFNYVMGYLGQPWDEITTDT